MTHLPLAWIAVVIGAVAVLAVAVYTVSARRRVDEVDQRRGTIWKRAFHLGTEIVGGRDLDGNTKRLGDFLATTADPLLAASALAVVIRQAPSDAAAPLLRGIRRSRLPSMLHDRLQSNDHNSLVETLEMIEVLQLHSLLGDAAALSRHEDPLVVRAACDTVVALDPRIGLGILVALVGRHESWVLDAVGRAIRELRRRGDDTVPLASGRWRSAPMLATRALLESATFDRATVNDAVSTLIACLDDPSSAMRLAAIKALSECITNTAAQLALAGALGAPDRMTRYAAAAALSDHVVGRRILEQAARSGDDSDAARMATEILWSEVVDPDGVDLVA